MSMIENLDHINKLGILSFIENEKIKWTCPVCGGTICVHRGFCYSCGTKKVVPGL
jgi:rubrerythrin